MAIDSFLPSVGDFLLLTKIWQDLVTLEEVFSMMNIVDDAKDDDVNRYGLGCNRPA